MKLVLNKLYNAFFNNIFNVSILISLFLTIIVLHNNSKSINENNVKLKKQVQNLKTQIKKLNISLQDLKKLEPKIIIDLRNGLTFFKPINLKIRLYSKRPLKHDKNLFLCVPAAFTDDYRFNSKLIDGFFVERGELISNDINNELNGTCIIKNCRLIILPANNFDLNTNQNQSENSVFQQFLLIYNFNIIKNSKFENTLSLSKPLLRRAIVEIDDEFYITQSSSRKSMIEFQNILKSLKVKNAIYLDMGTYSEGWYKSATGKINIIGENMTETKKQSNWLVFEK